MIDSIEWFNDAFHPMKNFKPIFFLSSLIVLVSLLGLSACRAGDRVPITIVPTASPSKGTTATLTTVMNFTGKNGDNPLAVVQGRDGNLYGVTASGGQPGAGTVFRLTPEGKLTTLVQFNAEVNGYNPEAGLTLGQDGNFYGTTSGGGRKKPEGFGMVFRVTPGGQFTTLAVFDRRNGASPERPLIQASDGNFYGTTYMGGTKQQGTLFRLTPGGQLTTLIQFAVSDRPGGLDVIEGSDGNLYVTHGNFYGTQYLADGAATIFRLTADQKLIPLSKFRGLNQGMNREAYPGRLIQARDGNFYGVTLMGTFFRLTPDGKRTTIATFHPDLLPNSLIQASDGNFYGTATGRETTLPGAVFRITPTGEITPLIQFTGKNGRFPQSLMQARDGTFYGTTGQGGASDAGEYSPTARGTVFRLVVQ